MTTIPERCRLLAEFDPDPEGAAEWRQLAEIANVRLVPGTTASIHTALRVAERRIVAAPWVVLAERPKLTPEQEALYAEFMKLREHHAMALHARMGAYFARVSMLAHHRYINGAVQLADDTPSEAPDGTPLPDDWDTMSEADRVSWMVAHTPTSAVAPLLPDAEDDALGSILGGHALTVAESAWGAVNVSKVLAELPWPGADTGSVVGMASVATSRAVGINDVTREALARTVSTGLARGYSGEQIARGVAADNYLGVRDIIQTTYRNRSRAIAQYETAWAQNKGAVLRYKASDVESVTVLDDESENSDEECEAYDGENWSLDEADANPISHPYCVRAFVPMADA